MARSKSYRCLEVRGRTSIYENTGEAPKHKQDEANSPPLHPSSSNESGVEEARTLGFSALVGPDLCVDDRGVLHNNPGCMPTVPEIVCKHVLEFDGPI